MTKPSPRATHANTCELENSRGERFLIGLTLPSGGEPPMRFWDERTARDWLTQCTEQDSGALRHLATTVGVWLDLPTHSPDQLLDLFAAHLAHGQLTVAPAQAVQTHAMQTRVPEPEEVASVAPSKPQDNWIRIDCEAVLETPLGVSVADDAGSGIGVSTSLSAAA